jgi:hypothetical protein
MIFFGFARLVAWYIVAKACKAGSPAKRLNKKEPRSKKAIEAKSIH